MKRPFLNAVLFLLCFSDSIASASPSLCPHPQGERPALSFSLISFRPGDLDANCRQSVERARALGFTAVTLIPTFAYDRAIPGIAPQPGVAPGEIARCLDFISSMGMDVVYQPHLDSLETLSGNGEGFWRAEFDVHPDATYRDRVFGDYLNWTTLHALELRDQSSPRHNIVMSGELENSLQRYPSEWSQFAGSLRSSLNAAGIGQRIPIGINPNWYPLRRPGNPSRSETCGDFRQLVRTVDFVAPSMYGDWSHTSEGVNQVPARRAAILQNLQSQNATDCQVPEFSQRPLAFGEFGIGQNLQSAEMRLPAVRTPEFELQRRLVYENLLNWLRVQSYPAPQPPLSLWTLGIFDPVGIDPNSQEAQADSMIALRFRQYSLERCPGLTLPPLPTMPVSPATTPCPPLNQAPHIPFLTRLRIMVKPIVDRIQARQRP